MLVKDKYHLCEGDDINVFSLGDSQKQRSYFHKDILLDRRQSLYLGFFHYAIGSFLHVIKLVVSYARKYHRSSSFIFITYKLYPKIISLKIYLYIHDQLQYHSAYLIVT